MQKYPTYKPSNIDWIGEIPSHWEESKIKYKVQINSETLTEKESDDFEINYVEISDVNLVDGLTNYTKYLYSEAPSRARRIVKDGDIIVSTVRTYLKAIARIEKPIENLIVSTGFAVLRPINVNSKYLGFFAQSQHFIDETIANSEGVSYPAINSNEIGNINIFLPPLQEQQAIVAYLDEKTTLIDELIAKKERKIELLKEQRAALINQAVTKGLNAEVAFKDSGIEWIGEIPEHWEIVNFKHKINLLTDYTANGSFASLAENVEYLEEGFSRLVRLTDLRVNFENQGIYITEEAHNFLSKSELFGGELLIANVGAYAGLVLIMPETNQKMTLAPNMFLLRLNSNTKYYFYLLNSEGFKNHISMLAVSSAQPKLNKDNIKSLRVFSLPLSEQQAIVTYLDEQTALIDKNIELESQKIEKLKEYRQSLISNVVTGKIKVV